MADKEHQSLTELLRRETEQLREAAAWTRLEPAPLATEEPESAPDPEPASVIAMPPPADEPVEVDAIPAPDAVEPIVDAEAVEPMTVDAEVVATEETTVAEAGVFEMPAEADLAAAIEEAVLAGGDAPDETETEEPPAPLPALPPLALAPPARPAPTMPPAPTAMPPAPTAMPAAPAPATDEASVARPAGLAAAPKIRIRQPLAERERERAAEAPEEAPAAEDIAIDIGQLGLTYAAADGPVEALQGIDLKVKRGEFISLIGPSGCGKTTLLRVIADLERATAGSILVNGVTPEEARRQRAYGYVFQAPALYPWRTIAKNVALPLEIMGLSAAERQRRIQENLDLVNLTGFEKKFPWQLSGGMQQRASIARALAVEPDLLLMDEPFGALDEIVRDHLNEQLLSLWAKTNKTVVFVTHSIPEAVFLSTRIVVMTPRPGKIYDVIESGLPRDRNLDIRETPDFLKIAHRVRQGLRAGHSYED